MNSIKILEFSKKYNVPTSTIYKKIEEGELNVGEEKNGVVYLDEYVAKKMFVTNVFTFFFVKGGVGKTSGATQYSDYLVRFRPDEKTLLIDLDPQNNFSRTFKTFKEIKEKKTMYHFLEDNTPLEKIVHKIDDQRDIICSDYSLMRKQMIRIEDLSGPITELKKFFKRYNNVIIDCPGSFMGLTLLGMLLSDHLIMPLEESDNAVDALNETVRYLNSVLEFHPKYKNIKSIMDSGFDGLITFVGIKEYGNKNVDQEINNLFQKLLKNKFLIDLYIPQWVKIKERRKSGKSIFELKGERDREKVELVRALFDHIYKKSYEGLDI